MRTLYVLVTLLAAGCVSPPAELPAPPAAGDEGGASGYVPNLFLIDHPRPPGGVVHGGSEPMVLADRVGEYLWIGSTGGASRSADNGTTWENLSWPFLLSADGWSLAQDDVGRVYVSTTGIPNVEVYRSDDDGETWIRPGLPTRPPLSGVVDVAPVADRPWLAARGDGEVMLIHYDFGRTYSESCVYSTDAGETWTDRDPMMGVANAGRPDFDALGRFGFTGGDGKLYLLGQSANIVPRCAQDPQEVRMFLSMGAQPMRAASATGNTWFSAAPTSGNGAIQLAGYNGAAVKRLVVSPPILKANTYATVSAGPNDIAVAWYATETPGAWSTPGFEGSWNVYVARVSNFFAASPTIALTRLTTEPNHVGDICVGGIGCTGGADRDLLDYFGVEHDKWGGVNVAYVHDGDTDERVVRFARLT